MQMAANRIAIVVTSFAKLRVNALVVFSVLLMLEMGDLLHYQNYKFTIGCV